MIEVFSKEWFDKHQSKLLFFANTKVGRYVFRIYGDRSGVGKNKITNIQPDSITWKTGEQNTSEFRLNEKFGLRLYHAFKPVWWTIHAWDIFVANRYAPKLNLGFDTFTSYVAPRPFSPNSSAFGSNGYASGSGAVFSTARSTQVTSRQQITPLLYAITSSKYDEFYRGIMIWNTASLNDLADVTAVSLNMYISSTNQTLGDDSVHVVSTTATNGGDPQNLAVGSLSDYGTTSFDDYLVSEYATHTGGYATRVLDANGIANVSKTGLTKYALRLGWDLNNSFTGSYVNYAYTEIDVQDPDYTGTTRDPYLSVTYFNPVQLSYGTVNPYANGILKSSSNDGSSWSTVTNGDLYFATYSAEGDTTVPQLSADPSDIIRNILDYFVTNGGSVTYDGTSIDDTGTSVSYTFISQSCLESINKVLELSPDNWYWYIDPATNLFHFHEKNTLADHYLTLGKDIQKLDIEKRSGGIINAVFFTGGGDPVLYKRYQNTTSQGLYGIRATRVIDERVTTEETAELISNRILNTNLNPEVRIVARIADTGLDGNGYDIESVNIGDTINFMNVQSSTASSLWDVARYDVDRYDFNIYEIRTLYLQIVRKEYSPTGLNFVCSSIPPQITKRIEELSKNLNTVQTVNNPDNPS